MHKVQEKKGLKSFRLAWDWAIGRGQKGREQMCKQQTQAEGGRDPQMGYTLGMIGNCEQVKYGKGGATGQGTEVPALREELLVVAQQGREE